ncbi:hypothetical protein EDD80_11437 [Anseongella ginsenosidimutans]|uniref:Uncharacterized protein n=1 Tax=Anseongella ginsenosidimutans TaxID=496056 RepID=A0A4R3KPG6_9SPHI|nr:hypothetical protein [Anseongella ginsenosidimutans]QEC54068.1 hypothetical protein FRZ59_18165 [Anseongella ginsenosidimutans]TCS85167.1 hypothetical protein EDD80_11437 [Anseongella ginsenosidimutans]
MTLDEFKATFSKNDPPPGLPPALTAMWYDARGDWENAHDIAQDLESSEGSWIHAYLHRKEGDAGNAAYWYRRAGKPFPSGLSLEQEWEGLVKAFLDQAAQ